MKTLDRASVRRGGRRVSSKRASQRLFDKLKSVGVGVGAELGRASIGRRDSDAQVAGLVIRRLRMKKKTGAAIAKIFGMLANQWRTETALSSSLTDVVTHAAYQRIIGLGRPAVPLILAELAVQPDHWGWALEALTGENPVDDEDAGRLDRIQAAWLEWGHTKGLV